MKRSSRKLGLQQTMYFYLADPLEACLRTLFRHELVIITAVLPLFNARFKTVAQRTSEPTHFPPNDFTRMSLFFTHETNPSSIWFETIKETGQYVQITHSDTLIIFDLPSLSNLTMLTSQSKVICFPSKNHLEIPLSALC